MRFFAAIELVFLFFIAWAARADVLIKRDGGKLTGTVLHDPTDSTHVSIKTRFGVLRLPRDDIASIEISDEPLEEYSRIVERYQETPEDQFRLALWCREHGYNAEYRRHLKQVIALDPEHEEARRRLGFRKEDGKWVSRDQMLRERGLVKHKGRYVLPQERERAEVAAADRLIEQEYLKRIRLWQRHLRGANQDEREAARRELLGLDDPLAVEPAFDVLGENGDAEERRLLVDVLVGIDHPRSTRALLDLAIRDDHRENRLAAAKALAGRKSPELVSAAAQGLANNDNEEVNRTAEILAEIGDSTVLPPLIAALVTRHKIVRPPNAAEIARSTTATITPVPAADGQGTATHSAGLPLAQGFGVSQPPSQVIAIEEFENPRVLIALHRLTGENYGFNKARWMAWLRAKAAAGSRQVRP